ncbi:hypothetical protein [Clostridium tarantellae]|uniref:CBM6 domain-containing protein n=1 Tax=Clostridium tarantellae TaxID=39493 RepID=A0A6I1MUH0_9CLOT|nr:hypothetical protein [Clostridium tarantellae]MPQ43869.1 hypothetical protein [Clostridium tarantellae]
MITNNMFSTNYNPTLGTLLNGAYVNITTNLVEGIGGTMDGLVEVSLNVENEGKYNLSLNYLSPYSNSSLVIDTNDSNSQDVYFILQTTGSGIENIQIFNTVVHLKSGINKVKFHGNGVDVGPSIGTFNLEFIESTNTETNILNDTSTSVFSAGPSYNSINYDLALGYLFNGARINTSNNFVENLGGISDGSAEILLNVDKDGQYNLSIKYLTPYNFTTLKIDINGFDSQNIYYFPSTFGATAEDAQIFNIAVDLISGNNLIKFHGDGVNNSPNIGQVTVELIAAKISSILSSSTPLITNYDAVLGTFSNGASVNESTNFVDNIGGPMDGSVEVPLSVDKYGEYNLEFKYLAPLDNSALKIDVNDVVSDEVYFIPQTIGNTLSSAKTFITAVTLRPGNNKVKFHGNGVDIAPSIGTFTLNPVGASSENISTSVFSTGDNTLVTNYNATLGTFFNGASVNMTTNFVGNIGGPIDGAIEVPLTVNKEGEYNLELKYLSPFDNTALKIDVNDIVSDEVYFIPRTAGSTIDYVENFKLIINLKAGTNKIRFHGNGLDMAPSIGTFTVTPISVVNDTTSVFSTNPNILVKNYDASLGTLSNGSYVNAVTNFVDNLGGQFDGAVEVPLSIDKTGEYNLEFKYLAYDNTRLKLNINGIDLENNFFVAKTRGVTLNDVQLYNLVITLNAGINIIKFHGNGIDMAPSIGSFSINFINEILDNSTSPFGATPSKSEMVYDTTLGTIEGKASVVNNATKMLDNIGGVNMGASTVNVAVESDGMYSLDLNYLSPNGISKLKIDVNDFATTTIYSLEKTDGMTVKDIKSFETTLNLNKGTNKLKFYGEESNTKLSIGKFTIKPYTMVDIKVYNANTGSLVNGAVINKNTKFVDNIGGKLEGATKIPIAVDNKGKYNLAINYLSPGADNTIKITINDITTLTTPLVKTMGASSSSAKIANILVELNKGNNMIKISGEKSNKAFSVGVFTLLLKEIVNDIMNTGVLYDISTATLANGASLNKTTKFVENIGGKTMGTAELTIDIPNNGPYYLDLNYLSPSGDSSLKIDVNNKNTGTIYHMEKTPSNNMSDVKVYNIPLDLLSGKYSIKFYGDETNASPNLGNFSITPITIINEATIPIMPTSTLSKEYSLEKGKLSNGAIINTTTKFIENLGGQNDGAVEITTITIPMEDTYMLAFYYLSPNGDSSLQISINDIDTGESYTLAQTDSENMEDMLLFMEILTLNKGVNRVYFHGDGSDDGPSFEKITLTPIKVEKVSSKETTSVFSMEESSALITNYDTALGILANGARINEITSFVDNIGGVSDGESEIILTVYDGGIYNLNLKYLSPYENTILKIMVNDVDSDKDYVIPETLGANIEDAKIFNTTINLTEGKNLIKFHGNKINNGPSLSTFVIQLVEPTNNLPLDANAQALITDYDLALGILSNGAVVNKETNFVDNLGGTSDGAVQLTLTVDKEGLYRLDVVYLSIYGSSILKFDLNGVSSEDRYFIPQTQLYDAENLNVFSVNIDLLAGENIIKFHGDGIEIAPSIGPCMLTPLTN